MRKSIALLVVPFLAFCFVPLGALLLAFPLWPVLPHTLLAQSLRFSFRNWRLFTYGFLRRYPTGYVIPPLVFFLS